MSRVLALVLVCLGLTACTNANDLDRMPPYLGNFYLGHNVIVAPNLTMGPASREASKEEWIAAMETAIEERFGRYDGDTYYHLGVSVEGYVLAVPGVPLVASPKSALIIRVTAWDDAAGKKLNEEPETITVIESISGDTILGSGLTQSKEVQMQNLSRNAAKQIQNWLVKQNNDKGWFEDDGQPAKTKPASQKQVRVKEGAIPDAGDTDEDSDEDTDAAARAQTATKVIEEPEVSPSGS